MTNHCKEIRYQTFTRRFLLDGVKTEKKEVLPVKCNRPLHSIDEKIQGRCNICSTVLDMATSIPEGY